MSALSAKYMKRTKTTFLNFSNSFGTIRIHSMSLTTLWEVASDLTMQ